MKSDHIHVEIEPTNICNTRCLHCPHEALSRPYGKMDWETYQTILDKVMEVTPNFSVEYAGMGEPLLNPNIYEFIKYVSGKGRTTLTTNASALTVKNAERLVEAGLHGMTISFNGNDKEIYEVMMGGLNFERAQQNLKSAIEISRGTGTQIGANVSVTRQTQDRLEDIRHFLNDSGVESIYFSKCHSRGGFLKGDLICITPPPPQDDYRCDIFTNTLFVAWTGEVLSCCHDLAGANVIGDLKVDSINSIFSRKKKVALEGVKFDICKNCNDLYRFMDDSTPDKKPIADWVYNLYTQPEQELSPEVSSLSEWLFNIYQQEGQGRKVFYNLVNQVQERDREIQAILEEKNREIQSKQALQAELDAVHTSRTWRFIESIQRVRRVFIPTNSRREQLYKRVLKVFG